MESLERLRSEFDKDDEVDYSALAEQLGSSALPALAELVRSDDPRIASQAAYLAGLIDGSSSLDVVLSAARSEHDIVRVAAAFTLTTLPVEQAARIAGPLLSDRDAGVRARAVRFAVRSGVEPLVARVREIAEEDPEQWVRDLAADLLDNGGGRQS